MHLLAPTLLLTALAAPGPAQETQAAQEQQILEVPVSSHRILDVGSKISRVAVGDPEVLSYEILDDRELLLLGNTTGRTSVLVWTLDAGLQDYQAVIQPDLTLLRETLQSIAPGVQVDSALDRDAIVLRGVVPTFEVSLLLESSARAWLEADADAPQKNLFAADGSLTTEDLADAPGQAVGRVINLLSVSEKLPTLEARISDALVASGMDGIRVTRVQRGPRLDDALDGFMLEGEVADQTELSQALFLATLAIDPELVETGIEVLADESGALSRMNQNAGGQQNQNQVFQSQNQAGGVFQGGQGGGNQSLGNRLRDNLGRATVIAAADGRLLSFLRVADLPQVRVDIELYEIDRTSLASFESSVSAVVSDFQQGSLSAQPSILDSSPLVGSVTPEDAQGVLDLLDGAGAAGLQVAGSQAALSATLEALETLGFARSLSRPSITVLSGEQAQFQVGGEIPVPTSFAAVVGGGTQGVFNSVAFQPFGVRLQVRPLVQADGSITLDLVPEIVSPDTALTTAIRDATGTDPLTVGLETRALRTTTRVDRGAALVIGGLLQQAESGSSSGIPGLSQLPLVGWLFGRESQQSSQNELIIVVSPRRVLTPRPEAARWAHRDPVELVLAGLPQADADEEESEEGPQGLDSEGPAAVEPVGS